MRQPICFLGRPISEEKAFGSDPFRRESRWPWVGFKGKVDQHHHPLHDFSVTVIILAWVVSRLCGCILQYCVSWLSAQINKKCCNNVKLAQLYEAPMFQGGTAKSPRLYISWIETPPHDLIDLIIMFMAHTHNHNIRTNPHRAYLVEACSYRLISQLLTSSCTFILVEQHPPIKKRSRKRCF